jgi:hypothetical protein
MILNPSDASGSSVNMGIDGNNVVAPANVQNNVLEAIPLIHEVLHVGEVLLGPELPPDMRWKNILDRMIPSLLSKEIPASVKLPSLFFAKSSWNISLDSDMHSAFQKHMQF